MSIYNKLIIQIDFQLGNNVKTVDGVCEKTSCSIKDTLINVLLYCKQKNISVANQLYKSGLAKGGSLSIPNYH